MVMSLLWALLQEMLLAAVPALGFAMVFNVPLRCVIARCLGPSGAVRAC